MADCVFSYARAAGRGPTEDQSDLIMDEEETERAADFTGAAKEQSG